MPSPARGRGLGTAMRMRCAGRSTPRGAHDQLASSIRLPARDAARYGPAPGVAYR